MIKDVGLLLGLKKYNVTKKQQKQSEKWQNMTAISTSLYSLLWFTAHIITVIICQFFVIVFFFDRVQYLPCFRYFKQHYFFYHYLISGFALLEIRAQICRT